MLNNRYWRWIALALTLFALLSVILISLYIEDITCIGVIVKSPEELSVYGEKINFDFSQSLFFNGEPAPVDVASSTIYISQEINSTTTPQELYGTLEIRLNDHKLYFEDCENFDDLKGAVADGKRFKLLVINPENKYVEYGVVFTTLPVVRLDGEYSHLNTSDREVNLGNVYLWAPYDDDLGRYSVKSSKTEWNIRGATSALLPKKPLKLSLKTKKGNNKDLAFLGLGADDDWILNPMNTDDTDVREILAMSLWNESVSDSTNGNKMSTGKYVEAVINGSYSGLYLLQRRIDKKYLELREDEILFKGLHTWTAETPRQGYKISYTPLQEDETFALLENINSSDGKTTINLDSFIDVSLFIQLGAMHDNKGFNNMYYLLKPRGSGYDLSFIPWDTDLSFGIAYYNWFVYDHDVKLNGLCQRKELELIEETYPEIYKYLAQRWFELRKTTYSLENISSIIEDNTKILSSSGAQARDHAKWGKLHNGKDSVATLSAFIEKKIVLLDEYYRGFIEEP